jgi:hypothetical protein
MIEFLIAVVPLLLLVGSLLFGHYPGHRVAMRLAERTCSPTETRSAVRKRRQPPFWTSHAARGGLLIAFGLAQRPPPLAP